VARLSLRNGFIFGLASIALIFLSAFLENMIWYHMNNVALRLAATTLLLLVLASIIQILYLLLIRQYKVGI